MLHDRDGASASVPDTSALTYEAQKVLRSALLAHKAGDTTEALRLYEMILETHPNQVSVLFLAGKILMETGETERGLARMRRAVELEPSNPDSRLLLAHGLFFEMEYALSLDHYKQVLEQDPQREKIRYFIGRNLARMGRVDEAQVCLAQERLIDPIDANVLYELGLCRLMAGPSSREEGAALVRQAMALQPDLLGIEITDLTLFEVHRRVQKAVAPVFRAPNEPKRTRPSTPYACFSYPKCGTHLLSDIAQLITGDDFYWPDDYQSNAVPKDALDRVPDKHFLIGHWHINPEFGMDMRNKGYKAIVQYREPRDQMVSFYFYYTGVAADPGNMYSEILTNVSQEEAINRLIVGGHLKGNRIIPGQAINMVAWMDLWRKACFHFQIPVYFVSYEEMVENKVETVGRLARFLEMPLSREECEAIAEATGFHKRSATMEKNAAPKDFKRKGIVGDWKNHFTGANKVLFKAVSGDILERLGYETGDTW
ncbi:MAG: sulfotransferase domain-containing protein [Magnetococcales bacterium]|nr:sulfotransferase domain-containing protein [Magnetococcales bacterium]